MWAYQRRKPNFWTASEATRLIDPLEHETNATQKKGQTDVWTFFCVNELGRKRPRAPRLRCASNRLRSVFRGQRIDVQVVDIAQTAAGAGVQGNIGLA